MNKKNRLPELPTIDRRRLSKAIEALGLDPVSTRELHVYLDSIEVVVMLRDGEGRTRAAGDEIATARIVLPIDHGEHVHVRPNPSDPPKKRGRFRRFARWGRFGS